MMSQENHTNGSHSITALFLDIGGVLLTNGWDLHARMQAAETFHLDFKELDERHHLTFDTYEGGKLSLEEYLVRVVFNIKRPFTMEQFRDFMFSRSQPHNEMLALVRALKTKHPLKTIAVSNEGRELTCYRIQKFNLLDVIDIFVSSCFVHYRKPDPDIYRIALDISRSDPEQVIYIDDRLLFVEVAQGLGIQSIHHTSYQSTQKILADMGLSIG
jgi:putative hydrolase of the HAD superfamily